MIDFDRSHFDRLRANYDRFYNGTLGRPVLPVTFWGRDPKRDCPKNPTLAFSNVADFSITPEQIIDRLDYNLSCVEWVGEGYPNIYTAAFGPGCAAAFMGCEAEARNETVWFYPKQNRPISELHFEYDPNNVWFNRVKDVFYAGMERWRGQVVISQTDLGGVLDILASFRTTEELLCDLYDYPDEVKRCIAEIQAMWFRFYDELTSILDGSEGYTSWAGIYSDKPTYILQSDFSYMIGPEMFAEFTAPELKSSCQRLKNPFYHLDGTGQIAHIDSLLKIDELAGIQWICGSGEPERQDWTELYKKIADGGKKIEVPYNIIGGRLKKLADTVGADKIIAFNMGFDISRKDEVRRVAYNQGWEI